ncbi:hypothetical protein HPP92_015911 [Vanilla planifolia]|uniref:H15 domain-containing protein n=1 Tax=Vanilla planifolia TaxID=51239 RepID=A0A835QDU4_VANPL|nr:hypothetical protein HPP92_015911 [Vanilla planifolia]
MARCSVGAEVKSLFGFKNPSYASFELVHRRGCDGTVTSANSKKANALYDYWDKIVVMDKWRNMRVTANGCGSREKARAVFKRSKNVSRHDDNLLAISKMEGLIMEAITWLKEPKGSNKTAIATYIEEQYVVPTDFKFLLSAKLKALIGCGKLIKVKRKYRIAPPSPAIAEGRKSKASNSEAKRSEDEKCMAKLQIDAELERMRNMSAQEAAAAAAQAIAEAEKAIAEAEEATQEAEAAEADAEAAQAFAEAAMLTLKSRNTAKVVALPDRL